MPASRVSSEGRRRAKAAGRVGEGGPALARRVTREHIAFYKAVLEDIPLRLAADRYLGEATDLRVARASLKWIGEALRVAALRHGHPADARIIRVPLTRIERAADVERAQAPREARTPVPGTEAHYAIWRARQDLEFSDDELLASYESQYGRLTGDADAPRLDPRKRAQQERLRARQRDAFVRLERLLVTAPNLRDPPEAWFEPALAARLRAAGLLDMERLVHTVNGRGYRWWTHVRRMGEGGAGRVMAWLASHAAELGVSLRTTALTPRRQLAPAALQGLRPQETAIVPLEHLRLPVALDGRTGRNRADFARNKLRASNDLEAIQAWLRSRGEGTHTYRAYRKEAERFLLWALFEAKKPLSSLDVEDCIAYRGFLADPQPAERWISREKVERFSREWRPFVGPLSASSQRYAVTVLASLCEWLARQRYLDSNPWDGVPPLKATSGRRGVVRSFSDAEWKALVEGVALAPESPAKRRVQAVLAIGYGMGLRLAELANARVGDLHLLRVEGNRWGWMLAVEGKGGKVRDVPAPGPILEALARHLVDRGFAGDPRELPARVPLIGALQGEGRAIEQALTPSGLYKAVKRSFEVVALELAKTDKAAARRIAQASTHWLRHTHGSHAVAKDVPLETVKENLGHASLGTTTIYVTAEEARRFREMERFVVDAFGAAAV